jgi:outer membrane protein OmpA-like peptidoglycan-associated protein
MSKALLNDVIVVLKKHPNLKLKIEGHSCNTGETEEINQGISEKRANVVKNYLVKHGIDSKRFQTQGYGSTQPAAKNNTEFGKIRNRRVTFKIIE